MKYIKNQYLKKYFTILYIHLSRKETLKDNFVVEKQFRDDDFFSPIHAANLELLFAKSLYESKKIKPLELIRIKDIAEQTFFLFPARKGIISKIAFFTHILSNLVKYEDESHIKELMDIFNIDISYRSKAELGINIFYNKELFYCGSKKFSINQIHESSSFRKESKDRDSFGQYEIIAGSKVFSFPENPIQLYKVILKNNPKLKNIIKIFARINIHNFKIKEYQAYVAGFSVTTSHFMMLALHYCDKYKISLNDDEIFLTLKQQMRDVVRVDIEKYVEFDQKNHKIKIIKYFDDSIHHSIIEVLMGFNMALELYKRGFCFNNNKIFDINDFTNILITSVKKSYLMIERKESKEDLVLLEFLDKVND